MSIWLNSSLAVISVPPASIDLLLKGGVKHPLKAVHLHYAHQTRDEVDVRFLLLRQYCITDLAGISGRLFAFGGSRAVHDDHRAAVCSVDDSQHPRTFFPFSWIKHTPSLSFGQRRNAFGYIRDFFGLCAKNPEYTRIGHCSGFYTKEVVSCSRSSLRSTSMITLSGMS